MLDAKIKKKLVDKYNISNAIKKFWFNYKLAILAPSAELKSE